MSFEVPEDFYETKYDANSYFNIDQDGVIFSNKCYKKLQSLLNETIEKEVEERGTVFYGKKVGNNIIFDMFQSDLELRKDEYNNVVATINTEIKDEITKYTNKKIMNGEQYDYVMHIRVRSRAYLDKDGNKHDISYNKDLLSKFDIYNYRSLDKNAQPLSDNRITYLGAVLTTEDVNKPHITIIKYNSKTDDFTNIDDIKCIDNNQLYSINKRNMNAKELKDESEFQKVEFAINIFNQDKDKKINI